MSYLCPYIYRSVSRSFVRSSVPSINLPASNETKRQRNSQSNARSMSIILTREIFIISFSCFQTKDNDWHKTILEITTKLKDSLPVVDVAPYDIGKDNQRFKIELGPVCFMY